MHAAPIELILALALSALLAAFLSAWSLSLHRSGGAVELALLLAADGLYTLGYALEISRDRIEDILITTRVQYLGLAFLPTLLLLFVVRFVRHRPLGLPATAALLAIPATTLAAVFTVERHALFYVSPHVVQTDFFPMLAFERGPLYWLKLANEEILIGISIAILVRHALRNRGRLRLQATLVALGAGIPLASSVLYVLGGIPWRLDPAPLAGIATGALFAIALFQLRLFELVPAARALALDAVDDGFLVVDDEFRLQDLNRSARELLGRAAERGHPLPHGEGLLGAAATLSRRGEGREECRVEAAEGGERVFLLEARTVHDPAASMKGTAVLIRDVTESRRLMDRLERQALIDPLTGILNRRGLAQVLAKPEANPDSGPRRLAILLVDLDHFKSVNDLHGHAAGDAVLRQTSARLGAALRAQDILGRYGGEEFVVLLPDTDEEAARGVAERLRRELADRPLDAAGLSLPITASIGGAIGLVAPPEATEKLLSQADQAMYQAKSRGRNRVVFAGD